MTPTVLVLGAGGMLGHKLWQRLQDRVDTWATVRSRDRLPDALFGGRRVLDGVDASDFTTVEGALSHVRPTVVVNCIGVVKQLAGAKDPVTSIAINALLPHRIHAACRQVGARLLHVSTDCVFFGDKGRYREADRPDAIDLYGRSKLLGEVVADDALTLRTSIIGRELRGSAGLVEWFLGQRGGRVSGYTQAIFSGVTTAVLSALIADLLERPQPLSGLYHVASSPIDKHDLLCRLNRAFNAAVRIEPSGALRIDRSLDGTRLHEATGWTAPGWDDMIARLASDETPYEDWRHRVS